MSRETYARLVATGREIGMRIVGHAPRNLPFSVVVEARQHSIDHMEEIVYTEAAFGELVGPYVDLQFGRKRFAEHPELVREVPDFRPALAEEVAELAKRVREAGLHVTPTLIAFSTIQKTVDEDIHALQELPVLRYVPPTLRQDWVPERARFRLGSWKPYLAFMASYLERNVELQREMARAFHAAGVPLMTGTDAPFDFTVPGFSLHDELAELVACGLTPLEALRSATSVPAGFLGITGEAGAIAPGMVADLLLVEGDPLQDIAAARRVAGTFVRGRWLAAEDLRARLDAIAARNEALEARVRAIAQALDAGELEKALEAYRAEEGRDPHLAGWLERRINGQGYELLRAKRFDESIAVFRFNTQAFPEAFNTWDSLGEACQAKGDHDEAIRHFERSLELNPDNQNARRMIDQIVAELEDRGG
jgi:tetratricopeptide (TPR) repeat protein